MEKAKLDMSILSCKPEISKTLANPLRLAILSSLKGGERTVNELAEVVGVSQSNVSRHLALMRQRQIVKTRESASVFTIVFQVPRLARLAI